MNKMGNTPDGMNSRMKEAQEGTSNLEDSEKKSS